MYWIFQNRQELTDKTLQNEELRQKINRLKDKLYEARANAHYELKDMKGQIEKLTTLLETSIGQNDDLSKRLVCSMIICIFVIFLMLTYNFYHVWTKKCIGIRY